VEREKKEDEKEDHPGKEGIPDLLPSSWGEKKVSKKGLSFYFSPLGGRDTIDKRKDY